MNWRSISLASFKGSLRRSADVPVTSSFFFASFVGDTCSCAWAAAARGRCDRRTNEKPSSAAPVGSATAVVSSAHLPRAYHANAAVVFHGAQRSYMNSD